jgi:ATP-dependent Lon protease
MELPGSVPVMTLPSATLFPQALLPLYIFEPRYRQMLEHSLQTDRMFSIAMQKPDKQRESPCRVAGLGLIRVSVGHDDGTSHLILQGITRVELVDTVQVKPYRVAAIRPLVASQDDRVVIDALVSKVQELVEERVRIGPFPFPFSGIKNPSVGKKKKGGKQSNFSAKEILQYLESIDDPEQVADLVSCALLPGAVERQTILESVELETRLKHLVHFLIEEIQRLRDGAE